MSEAGTRGVFLKTDVLKNSTKLTGKHLYQSLFLINFQASAKRNKDKPICFFSEGLSIKTKHQ